jgi:hypothetical protein
LRECWIEGSDQDVSDEELRELERRALASENPAEVDAALRARARVEPLTVVELLRLGEVGIALGRFDRSELRALADVGLAPARTALALPIQSEAAAEWTAAWDVFLETSPASPPIEALTLLGPSTPGVEVRRALVTARHLLPEWEALGWLRDELDDPDWFEIPRRCLEAALSWAASEDEADAPEARGLYEEALELYEWLGDNGFLEDHGVFASAAVESAVRALRWAAGGPDRFMEEHQLLQVIWRTGGQLRGDDPPRPLKALAGIRNLVRAAVLPWVLGLDDSALAPLDPPPREEESSNDPADTDEILAAGLKADLAAGRIGKLELRLGALRGDRAARLALPDSRGLERWDAFVSLVERWHVLLFTPRDGLEEHTLDRVEEALDLELPLVLWEFYRLVGARVGRWSQDPVFRPAQLSLHEGLLLFAGENQGCFSYGVQLTDLERDDPPVWIVGEEEELQPAADSLATLLQTFVFRDALLESATMGAAHSPLGELHRVQTLEQSLTSDAHTALASAYDLALPRLAALNLELRGDARTLLLLEGPRAGGVGAQHLFAMARGRAALRTLRERISAAAN